MLHPAPHRAAPGAALCLLIVAIVLPASASAQGFTCEASAVAATLGPSQLKGVALAATAERELAVVHRALITWHLEKDLRSARVLREMRQADRH